MDLIRVLGSKCFITNRTSVGVEGKQEVAIGLFDDVLVRNPEPLRTCPPSLLRLDRSRIAPVKDR